MGERRDNGQELPVLAGTEARPIERARRAALPVPATAATGGVVLAAATYLLVRILRRPARRRATLSLGRGRNRLEIAGSRSFLVDVHVLKR